MDDCVNTTPATEPAATYEAPELVDLGALEDLTEGFLASIPDVNGFGKGPRVP